MNAIICRLSATELNAIARANRCEPEKSHWVLQLRPQILLPFHRHWNSLRICLAAAGDLRPDGTIKMKITLFLTFPSVTRDLITSTTLEWAKTAGWRMRMRVMWYCSYPLWRSLHGQAVQLDMSAVWIALDFPSRFPPLHIAKWQRSLNPPSPSTTDLNRRLG